MAKITRYVGLDVHAGSISVAVADGTRGGEVRFLGNIPNSESSIRKLLKKLGKETKLAFCYEAGPCGYQLYWQLTKLEQEVMVVAPSLIPMKAGDRVKTDRRDAEKLARSLRAGELTAVWVPSRSHEALRSLVRVREGAKKDQLRARNQLTKFLLYMGRKPKETIPRWKTAYMAWLDGLRFEDAASQAAMVDLLAEVQHASARIARLDQSIDDAISQASPETQALIAALQTLRGVATITAATIAAEVGQMSRFSSAKQLMAYAGVVPSEHSSGGPGKANRGSITKAGNAHLRRIIIESAWSYRHKHKRERFESSQRLLWAVGMGGCHRSIVACVHSQEHVESFSTPALPNDHSIRTHTHGVFYQVADRNGPFSLHVGWPSFQGDNVVLL